VQSAFIYYYLLTMLRTFSFHLAISFASLLLVSCVAIQEQITTEPSGWVAEQQKRQQIKNWEIRGRLGVHTENNGGSLDIIWKQVAQDYSIHLIAPFGAGNYHIQGDETFAEIRFPDGRKKIVYDVDDIFSAALEINLPVKAVKDWIRGLPARSMPVEKIRWNSQGLLHTIKQSGWNVELKKYTGSSILLPHAVYLSRDDNDELDIRLVLRQWMVDN